MSLCAEWIAERTEDIQYWINARKEANEITKCVFYITTPKLANMNEDNRIIKKVKAILNKNNIKYKLVDTVPGAWNLNRDWIETEVFDCAVEFCGVYPINWDLEDVIKLEDMEVEGKIIITVVWLQNGAYIPNH